MWLRLTAFLAACSGPGQKSIPKDSGLDGSHLTGDSAEQSDSAAPTDTSGPIDTAGPTEPEDTAVEWSSWACPEGMVPVTAAGEEVPAYCIDPHESTVVGDLGDLDQHTGAGVPTAAIAVSEAGVIPATRLSFGQAYAACANTPVLDAAGVEVGRKRLPTSSEWADAADGLVGPGGWNYPYGDTWVEHACATPQADGEVVLSGLQPTGSYPDCISAFGVYDAIGNAWEWTDSGFVLDVEAWFTVASAIGADVTLGPDGTLIAGPGATGWLELRVQGITSRVPEVDAAGTLLVGSEAFGELASDLNYTGFLVLREDSMDLAFLPIRLDVSTSESSEDESPTITDENILMYWEAEGAAVPDKRGCPYYVGDAFACTLGIGATMHMYDFTGTISFRCIADPVFSAR